MPSDSLKSLFKRLRDAHLDMSYVRDVLLPEWWNDEVASTESGLYEAMSHIATRLGISIGELRGPKPPDLALTTAVRYKLTKGTAQADVSTATWLALQVARTAVIGARRPDVPLPTAGALRARLLTPDHVGVGFVPLLDWCWSAGIVALHVPRFPKRVRKPQAFTAVVQEIPVIILCGQWHRPAWLLFHLAHELGHLALGHIKDGEVLVDDEIDTKSTEAQEVMANAYALQLLTGDPKWKATSKNWPTAVALAGAAIVYGRYAQIDPGHVVLNFARNMSRREQKNFHLVANSALEKVEGSVDALEILRERARKNLTLENVSESARDFVEHMLSLSEPA